MVTRNKFTIDKLFLYTPLKIDSATRFLDHIRSPVEPSRYNNSLVNLKFKKSGNTAELVIARNTEPQLLHEQISTQLGGLTARSHIRIRPRDDATVRDMRLLLGYFSDYQQPWYITALIGRQSPFLEHVLVLGANLAYTNAPEHTFAFGKGMPDVLPELFSQKYQNPVLR